VSIADMRLLRHRFVVVAVILALAVSGTAQRGANTTTGSDTGSHCSTHQRLYTDRRGNPIWLETAALLKRATYCEAPKMPGLAGNLRMEGQVYIEILVNGEGKVSCARIVNGHPLLVSSAIYAAKEWTVRPKKQHGKHVWFYGHLLFHFSTGKIDKTENRCTAARW
jgi:TonB family protein